MKDSLDPVLFTPIQLRQLEIQNRVMVFADVPILGKPRALLGPGIICILGNSQHLESDYCVLK